MSTSGNGDTIGWGCNIIGGLSGRMNPPLVMTVNNGQWMSGMGPVQGKASRISNTGGTPVRSSGTIGETSVPIARTVRATNGRSERSDLSCTAIGKTCEPTIVGFEVNHSSLRLQPP